LEFSVTNDLSSILLVEERGFAMMREWIRKWHDLLGRFYDLLAADCICPEKKRELLAKSRLHFLKSRFN
jgi:hypothetical protein